MHTRMRLEFAIHVPQHKTFLRFSIIRLTHAYVYSTLTRKQLCCSALPLLKGKAMPTLSALFRKKASVELNDVQHILDNDPETRQKGAQ